MLCIVHPSFVVLVHCVFKIDIVVIPDNHMFQYFITVVPTKLHTSKVSADTHQFSVTERVSPRVFPVTFPVFR